MQDKCCAKTKTYETENLTVFVLEISALSNIGKFVFNMYVLYTFQKYLRYHTKNHIKTLHLSVKLLYV
jgi:hypothetical protein